MTPGGTVPTAYAVSDEAWAKRPDEVERLDRAAQAAHDAYFVEKEIGGIELELWRNVVRAVRAADAHRQAS